MGSHTKIIPSGRAEIKHDEIATGLDAVGNQSPVLISPGRKRKTKMSADARIIQNKIQKIKTYFPRYSTTKYSMGQPPSDQALRWSVTLLAEPSINRLASGTAGADPLVRVLITSDPSPVPILIRIWMITWHQQRALCFTDKHTHCRLWRRVDNEFHTKGSRLCNPEESCQFE